MTRLIASNRHAPIMLAPRTVDHSKAFAAFPRMARAVHQGVRPGCRRGPDGGTTDGRERHGSLLGRRAWSNGARGGDRGRRGDGADAAAKIVEGRGPSDDEAGADGEIDGAC